MYDIYYLHGTACVPAWGDHDQLQAAPPAAEDIWTHLHLSQQLTYVHLDILILLNILDKAYGYFFIDAFPKQLCNEDKYLIMR